MCEEFANRQLFESPPSLKSREKHRNHVRFNVQKLPFLKCPAARAVLCATHNDMPHRKLSERDSRTAINNPSG